MALLGLSAIGGAGLAALGGIYAAYTFTGADAQVPPITANFDISINVKNEPQQTSWWNQLTADGETPKVESDREGAGQGVYMKDSMVGVIVNALRQSDENKKDIEELYRFISEQKKQPVMLVAKSGLFADDFDAAKNAINYVIKNPQAFRGFKNTLPYAMQVLKSIAIERFGAAPANAFWAVAGWLSRSELFQNELTAASIYHSGMKIYKNQAMEYLQAAREEDNEKFNQFWIDFAKGVGRNSVRAVKGGIKAADLTQKGIRSVPFGAIADGINNVFQRAFVDPAGYVEAQLSEAIHNYFREEVVPKFRPQLYSDLPRGFEPVNVHSPAGFIEANHGFIQTYFGVGVSNEEIPFGNAPRQIFGEAVVKTVGGSDSSKVDGSIFNFKSYITFEDEIAKGTKRRRKTKETRSKRTKT